MFVILQEASELSSLKVQLDKLDIPLYAVVKESIKTEIQDFKAFFSGDVFVDVPVILKSFSTASISTRETSSAFNLFCRLMELALKCMYYT